MTKHFCWVHQRAWLLSKKSNYLYLNEMKQPLLLIEGTLDHECSATNEYKKSHFIIAFSTIFS